MKMLLTICLAAVVASLCPLDAAQLGQMLWESPVCSDSSPAIGADGTVYVGSGHSNVCALNGATEQKRWEFKTGNHVYSSPAIGADGTVYVGSLDGNVYALCSSSVGGLAESPWPKFRHDAQNTGCRGQAPGIEKQPRLVVLKEGQEGRITVKVSGVPVPQVQWFFNGAARPGDTNATLILPAVTWALEGTYLLVPSNTAGQATSAPIVAVVSNVDRERFVGLRWEGGSGGPVSLEATAQLGALAAWHSLSNYPSGGAAQFYAEVGPVEAARFYRVNGASVRLSAGRLNGWWMQELVGSRIQIEVVSVATGWTNWQTLTNLALAASPYLFLDEASLGAPERVYRTTVLP